MLPIPQNTPPKSWWHELHTWEPETALAFYGRTLGWEFEPLSFEPLSVADSGSYWLARKEGQPVAGIFELTTPDYDGTPSHWMTYLEVADIHSMGLATCRAGGEILRPPVLVAGLGTLAVVTDQQGAMIGLFEPSRIKEVSIAA